MKEHQRKLRGLLRIVFGRSAYVVLFSIPSGAAMTHIR